MELKRSVWIWDGACIVNDLLESLMYIFSPDVTKETRR